MNPPGIRWTLILLCLALNAARLHAQDTEGDAPEPGEDGKVRVSAIGGIRYGAPLGASLYGGIILGDRKPDVLDGPSVIAEVGQDGMRASLGVSSLSLGGLYRAQVSVIRTWDSHGSVRPDQTYVGPELAFGLIGGVTVGHYWRISDGGGKARIFAIGSFIGF